MRKTVSKPTKTHPHHSAKDLTKREFITIEILKILFEGKKDDEVYISRGYHLEDAVRMAHILIEELNKQPAPRVKEDEDASNN